MLTVEALPAGYGDALLVTYGTARERHHILIDGGQSGTFPALAARLRALDGPIDLFVVTHVDKDHIGGAVKLLRNARLASQVGAIWFNGYVHLDRYSGLLGPIDGEKLTSRIVELGLPWNVGWPGPVSDAVGGPVVVDGDPPVMPLPGGATATLLSPTPQKLAELLPVWTKVVEAEKLRPGVPGEEEPPVVAPGLLGGTLEDLATARTPTDHSEANGSSIAFVFEFDGVRVLFGADAHPDALVAGLAQLAGPDGRYRVDACKLPHHGSKGNVTTELVNSIDCPLWLISTNGRRFHHPDDVALARIVHHAPPGQKPRLVWNYLSDRYRSWLSAFPPESSGYTVDCPPEGSPGRTVQL